MRPSSPTYVFSRSLHQLLVRTFFFFGSSSCACMHEALKGPVSHLSEPLYMFVRPEFQTYHRKDSLRPNLSSSCLSLLVLRDSS